MGLKEFFENVFLPKVGAISKEAPVPEIKKEFISGQPQQDAFGKTGTQYFGGWITEDYKNDLEGRNGVLVYDKMFRGDYQVYTTIERGNNKIKTANWFIEAPDEKNEEDTQEARIIAKYLLEKQPIGMNKNWMDNLNDILTFRRYGISVFEPTWVEVNDEEFGRLWVPKSLGWRSAKTLWQVFFKDDKVWSVRQISYGDSYNYVDIPGSELIIFTYRKEGNNIYGVPPTRPMYGPWIRKDNAHKVNAMGIENNARGMIHMEIPDDKLLGEEAANAKKAVNGYAKGVVPALFTPKGWAVNFKETRYDSKATQDSIRMEDAAIAKTTENEQSEMGLTEVGSKGMHSSKQAESDGAIKVDATYICQTLQDLIDKFVEYNFAPRVRKGKHKLNFTGVDNKPGGEEIAKDKALMEMGFLSNQNPIDVAYMRKKYDLPGGSELEDADKDKDGIADKDEVDKEVKEHGDTIEEIKDDAKKGKDKPDEEYAKEIVDAHKKEASENFTFGGPGSGRYPAGSGKDIPDAFHTGLINKVSDKYKNKVGDAVHFIIKDGKIKEVEGHNIVAKELGYEGHNSTEFLRSAGYSVAVAFISKDGKVEISGAGLRSDINSLMEELGGTKDDIRQFKECSCGHKHMGGEGSGRYPKGSGEDKTNECKEGFASNDITFEVAKPIEELQEFHRSLVIKDGEVKNLGKIVHLTYAQELGYKGKQTAEDARAFLKEKGYSLANTSWNEKTGKLTVGFTGRKIDGQALAEFAGGTKDDISFSETTRQKSCYEEKVNFAEVDEAFKSYDEKYLALLKDSITNFVLPKYKADLINALKQKNKLAAVANIELSKESKIAELLDNLLSSTVLAGRLHARAEMVTPKTFGGPGSGRYPKGTGDTEELKNTVRYIDIKTPNVPEGIEDRFFMGSYVIKNGEVTPIKAGLYHSGFAKTLGWKNPFGDKDNGDGNSSEEARKFLLKNGYSVATTSYRNDGTLSSSVSGRVSDAQALAEFLGGTEEDISRNFSEKSFVEDISKLSPGMRGWVKANAKLIAKKQLEKLDTKLVFTAKRAIENDLTDEQIIFETMEEGESYTNDAAAMGAGYATSEAINEGRWSMFQEMSNELQGFEFSALLEKTCDLCAELDSMTFKVNDPDSVPLTPPLHPHCHCILIPIMNDEPEPDEWDGLDSVKSKFTPEEFDRLKQLTEVY